MGCKVVDPVPEDDRLPVVADCDPERVCVRVGVRTMVSLRVAVGPVSVVVAVPEVVSGSVPVDEADSETDRVRVLLALWVRLPLRLYVVVTWRVGVWVRVPLSLRLGVCVPERNSVTVSVCEWLSEGTMLRDGVSLSGLRLQLPLEDGVQELGVMVEVRWELERVGPSVREGVGEPGETVWEREADKLKVTVTVGDTVVVGWTVGLPVGVLLVDKVRALDRLMDGVHDRVRVWECETEWTTLAEDDRVKGSVHVWVGVAE